MTIYGSCGFEEAGRLVFAEAEAGDMKPEAAGLFATTLEQVATQDEVKKLAAAEVKSET